MKRNSYYFLAKNSLIYKTHFSKFNYIFHYSFKSNPLLNVIVIRNLKKKNNFIFSPLFTKPAFNLTTYISLFFQNSTPLIGGPISPYFSYFLNPKKWLRKSYALSTSPITSYLLSGFSAVDNANDVNNLPKDYSKKIILNSVFYNQSLPLDITDTGFVIKVRNNTVVKNDKWLFTKPYQFLFTQNLNSNNYRNNFTIQLFFKHSKLYSLVKKLPNFHSQSIKIIPLFKNFNSLHSSYDSLSYLMISKKIDKNNHKIDFFSSSFIKSTNMLFSEDFSDQTLNYLNTNRASRKNLFSYFVLFLKKSSKGSLLLKKNMKLNKTLRSLTHLISFSEKPDCLENSFNWGIIILPKNTFGTDYTYFNKNRIGFIKYWFDNYDFNKTFSLSLNPKNVRSHILKNYKPLMLFSKDKNSFLLRKHGFLFLVNPISHIKNLKWVSEIKKNLFSFSFKNELQKLILKRYSKINTSLILGSEHASDLVSLTTNDFSIIMKNDLHSHSKSQNSLSFFSMISKSKYLSTKEYYSWEEESNDDYNFNLKRIKFKPGYMTIWREARSVLKLSLNLKIRYQHRLTRYLAKFNKFIRFKTFLVNETTFNKFVIKSKLIPDFSLTLLFIKNGMFYLNGIPCLNGNLVLLVGDLVQMIVSFKYYIFYKWLINWNLKKKIRLKQFSWKKLTISINYEDKQRSKNLPKWILNNRFLILDTPSFLEVDYFSLSFFVLYEPFLWTDSTFYNIYDNKFAINNLYNWKYIT